MTERDVREYLGSDFPKPHPLPNVWRQMSAWICAEWRQWTRWSHCQAGYYCVPPNRQSPAQPLPVADVVERVPLKGVRGIIAERMAASVHTTARVTLVMEVDATEFVAARERIKAKVVKIGALLRATMTCWQGGGCCVAQIPLHERPPRARCN